MNQNRTMHVADIHEFNNFFSQANSISEGALNIEILNERN